MIIQGHFINYDNEFFGQVKINNKGLIEKFGQNLGIPDLKYNNDILIFPGFIDVHMHCREDTTQMQNHKEDFLSASEAAINGGLVHIFDMPNNSTPPIDNTSFLAKKNLTKNSYFSRLDTYLQQLVYTILIISHCRSSSTFLCGP